MTHAHTAHFAAFNGSELNDAFDIEGELHIDYLAQRLVEVAASFAGDSSRGLVEIAGELAIPLNRHVQEESSSSLARHMALVYPEAVTAFLAKHR